MFIINLLSLFPLHFAFCFHQYTNFCNISTFFQLLAFPFCFSMHKLKTCLKKQLSQTDICYIQYIDDTDKYKIQPAFHFLQNVCANLKQLNLSIILGDRDANLHIKHGGV